jgi:hypothetical protein
VGATSSTPAGAPPLEDDSDRFSDGDDDEEEEEEEEEKEEDDDDEEEEEGEEGDDDDEEEEGEEPPPPPPSEPRRGGRKRARGEGEGGARLSDDAVAEGLLGLRGHYISGPSDPGKLPGARSAPALAPARVLRFQGQKPVLGPVCPIVDPGTRWEPPRIDVPRL